MHKSHMNGRQRSFHCLPIASVKHEEEEGKEEDEEEVMRRKTPSKESQGMSVSHFPAIIV